MNDSDAMRGLGEQAASIVAELERALAALCQVAARDAEAAIARVRAEAAADAQVLNEIKQAELETEIHNRMAVAAELQATNEKLLQAKAEAAALRLQLESAKKASRAEPAVAEDQICGALDRVRRAMAKVGEATSG